MPATNHQVRLKTRPSGTPTDDDFEVTEEPVADPEDGQFVVRVTHISLDPAMRGWMREGESYVPPVELGEVMRAIAVGEVIASNHDKFAVGDHVTGMFGIQQYAVSDGKGIHKVDPDLAPLATYLGALGMPGMTAYFGLLDVGKATEGDTVVVSGAAGAVGSTVGQIAKLKGCRAIGIAGGADKCRHVVEDLGFDACIDYKNENVRKALREHAPDGVDVYFDNVGNPILDAVLTRIARGARIVICGAIAQYNADRPEGPANYLQLLVRRATMTGFVVFDFADRYEQAGREIAGWMAEGKFTAREDIVKDAVQAFPQVLRRLFDGDNVGKLVLEVEHP
jgi:NADPH-dependent curcumin reductase CurA